MLRGAGAWYLPGVLPPHPLAGELEVIDQVFGTSRDAIVVISVPPRSVSLRRPRLSPALSSLS